MNKEKIIRKIPCELWESISGWLGRADYPGIGLDLESDCIDLLRDGVGATFCDKSEELEPIKNWLRDFHQNCSITDVEIDMETSEISYYIYD